MGRACSALNAAGQEGLGQVAIVMSVSGVGKGFAREGAEKNAALARGGEGAQGGPEVLPHPMQKYS